MFVSLSILLLLLFILGFWIVKESKAYMWLKLSAISLFFLFCVILSPALESSLGWAANGKNLPRIVTIRHVVIKEPNQQLNFEGAIYLLLDMPPTKYDSMVLRMFGHKSERMEPRLFRITYNRPLHEALQKNVVPKLMKGQTVTGKLGKGGDGDGEGEDGDGDGSGNGNGKGGKGKKGGKKGGAGGRGDGGGRGGGSDSLEKDDMMFYELPPSYFRDKE